MFFLISVIIKAEFRDTIPVSAIQTIHIVNAIYIIGRIKLGQTKNYFLILLVSASMTWGDFSLAAEADDKSLFPGNDQRHLSEAGKYRLEIDNDVLVDSDNGFSNAWSFQISLSVLYRFL